MIAVDQHGNGPIMLGAGDSTGILFAGDQAAFVIAGIAVGIVTRLTKYTDGTILLVPAHHAIVGNVAPNQAPQVAEVDRSLAPAAARGNALNGGVAYGEREAFVERLHIRVRIVRQRSPVASLNAKRRSHRNC